MATPTARSVMPYRPSRATPFSTTRSCVGCCLEYDVAAIDNEGVAGMVFRGVTGEIHGNAAEVFRLAPAAHRHTRNDLFGKGLRVLRHLSHFGRNPARSDRIGANAITGMLDGDRAHHRRSEERRVGKGWESGGAVGR